MEELIYCDNCGTIMNDKGCKLVCPKCHYFYSCSDFVYPQVGTEPDKRDENG